MCKHSKNSQLPRKLLERRRYGSVPVLCINYVEKLQNDKVLQLTHYLRLFEEECIEVLNGLVDHVLQLLLT